MDIYIIFQQIINGLTLGSIYGLIAIGYTMVYGIIGMINFAHGDIYMVSAYLTAIGIALLAFLGITFLPLALLLTLIMVVVITSIYGYTVEKFAYRPLRKSTKLSQLIAAIGVSLVLQNYVVLSQGARSKGIPPLIEGHLRIGSAESFAQITYIQLIIIIAAIAGMIALTYLIQRTKLGRECRATQQDIGMARILGINVDKAIGLTFVIGSFMAGLAGFLVTLNYGSFDFYIGFIIGIKAFTAAVLGGIGSLPGAMLGGIVLGMSEALFAGFINTDYKDVFAFLILVTVMIFKPTGFLGKPEVEKV
jgi:branched-chain amino acid transport system permease protein